MEIAWQTSRPWSCQRPYHAENTSSRPIPEVKQHWARLVLGWETAWEPLVLLASFLFWHCYIPLVSQMDSTRDWRRVEVKWGPLIPCWSTAYNKWNCYSLPVFENVADSKHVVLISKQTKVAFIGRSLSEQPGLLQTGYFSGSMNSRLEVATHAWSRTWFIRLGNCNMWRDWLRPKSVRFPPLSVPSMSVSFSESEELGVPLHKNWRKIDGFFNFPISSTAPLRRLQSCCRVCSIVSPAEKVYQWKLVQFRTYNIEKSDKKSGQKWGQLLNILQTVVYV